jgi:hypothetical protein
MSMEQKTPFIQQQTGGWVLILREGESLMWGTRFDDGFGYRVFIKWAGAEVINAIPANTARQWATEISKNEDRREILALAGILRSTAKECDALNRAWAAKGAPSEALDKEPVAGHA